MYLTVLGINRAINRLKYLKIIIKRVFKITNIIMLKL